MPSKDQPIARTAVLTVSEGRWVLIQPLKELLGDLFRFTKNRREATPAIFTHVFGWEVRLLIGPQLETVQSQVCRTQEELLATGEEWKDALLEKGWAPV